MPKMLNRYIVELGIKSRSDLIDCIRSGRLSPYKTKAKILNYGVAKHKLMCAWLGIPFDPPPPKCLCPTCGQVVKTNH